MGGGPSHPTAAPRQVLLFSGHRVDPAGREPARFPASKVAAAAAAIERALASLDAGPGDLALTQGAAGGDILFGEACLRRGVVMRLLLPSPEAVFIEESVRDSADGDEWVRRYREMRASAVEPPRVLRDVELDAGLAADRFERCNRWLLESALAFGPERLRFVCLWDGGRSGGPGGTAELVETVRDLGLPVIWLDARLL
jgi:hypothetical protein